MFSSYLIYQLLLVAVLSQGLVRSAPRTINNDPWDTQFVFYYGPDFNNSIAYNLSDVSKMLQHENFVHNLTHCFVNGFGETQESEDVHAMFEAYKQRGTVNFISLNWEGAQNEDYTIVAMMRIEELGRYIADAILDLYDAGLKRESLTLVGYSAGAQLARRIGNEVLKRSDFKVKIYKMVALDADSNFIFDPFLTLSSDDVEFFQAIHTDSGIDGISFEIGDVDFWPNGGQAQPGCPQSHDNLTTPRDGCNCQRSWRYWAESVANVNGTKFWAFPSMDYVGFEINLMNNGIDDLKDKAVEMGFDCPITARDNYYLRTNSKSPFAKGFNGY